MLLGMNMLLWTTHVTEKDVPILKDIKKAGFDGVEIPVFGGTPEDYRQIGTWLKDIGLRATAVGVMPDIDHSCLSQDAETRTRALSHIKWLIDCVAAAGGEVLCGPFHQPLGHFTGAPATREEWKGMIEVHREAAAYAEASGILLSVEPLNRFECYILNTVADAARAVREVGAANYGFLYDTFHQNIEEKDPVGCIAPAMGQINHVHLSENDRGTPGKGHVPWRETLRSFKRGGYDGWFVIEAFGQAMPEIAAATRVWRELSPSDEIYREGHDFLRAAYAEA